MRSLTTSLAVAALLIVGLTGCVEQGSPEPGDTQTPGPSESASPSPTPTASETAEAPEPTKEPSKPDTGFHPTPLSIDCNSLVNPQAVYDYNPNYGLQPSFTPKAGSDAALIVANKGVACSWVNQTSGATFVVAAAHLSAGDLPKLKADLSKRSTSASGVGDAAWFSASGGVGVAHAIGGEYWVVASSAVFEAVDGISVPAPLLEAALTALGE